MSAARALALRVALLPLAFAVGGVLARLTLRSAPGSIAVDRAQPLVVVTAWHGFGALLFALLAATLAVALLGCLATLRALRERPVSQVTATVVLGAGASAALVAILTWPVVFSSDVYAYAAYGDLAARGLDPYITPAPASVDGLLRAADWQWGGAFPPCVYGPAFVAFARGLVGALRCAPLPAVLFAFRCTACCAWLIAGAGLVALLGSRADGRTRALAAFWLNPVALWSVAEGHNDALMLSVVLTGAAVARRAPFWGAVAASAGGLIKAPALGVAAALLTIEHLRARAAGTLLAAGLLTGGTLTALFSWPQLAEVVNGLGRHSHYAPQASLQALVLAVARGLSPSPRAAAAGIALALLLCAIPAVAGMRALRARDPSGLAWLALAAWLAIPNPYPWYGLWLLPLAVVARSGMPFSVLWAATISVAFRYLPDAYGSLSPVAGGMLAAAALSPLLGLAGESKRRPAQEPALP